MKIISPFMVEFEVDGFTYYIEYVRDIPGDIQWSTTEAVPCDASWELLQQLDLTPYIEMAKRLLLN